MAFNVTFYNFSKKENSTATPASGGTVYACTLKDGCSIISPVIKLNLGPASDAPVDYNYCLIADFNRWYFINDWTSDKGMWYGSLNVDVLATYKTPIGSASEMIVRSSDEYDGRIIDQLYPTMNRQIFYTRDGSLNPWWNDQTPGSIVLGLLSYVSGSSIQGGVNYVSMLMSEFSEFMDRVFTVGPVDPTAPAATDGTVNAMRAVFTGMTEEQARNFAYLAENPYTDYIDSITWVPATGIGGSSQTGLYLGPNYLSDLTYAPIDIKEMIQRSWVLSDIPRHPQAATRGSYLNLAPYSKYELVLPRAGVVELDPVMIGDFTVLTVELGIDPVTGQGLYKIFAGDGANVKHMIKQLFVPIGVTAKIGRNKPVGTGLSLISDIIGTASGLVSGNLTAIRGIGNVLRETRSPGSGTIGDSGGYAGLFPGYVTLQSQHLYVTDEDNDHNGRPLMRVRAISDVPGYIVCQHGDIDVACTDAERAEIRKYLEGGFFYE